MRAVFLLIALIAVAGCTGGSSDSTDTQQTAGGSGVEGTLIHITSTGFSPSTITVAPGTTVTWINNDTTAHWVASARHPTHDAYPGAAYDESGSYGGTLSCAAEGQPKTGAFDTCKSLEKGDTYSFTFNQAGMFPYHDHVNPTIFATVVVQ